MGGEFLVDAHIASGGVVVVSEVKGDAVEVEVVGEVFGVGGFEDGGLGVDDGKGVRVRGVVEWVWEAEDGCCLGEGDIAEACAEG